MAVNGNVGADQCTAIQGHTLRIKAFCSTSGMSSPVTLCLGFPQVCEVGEVAA